MAETIIVYCVAAVSFIGLVYFKIKKIKRILKTGKCDKMMN